MILTYPRILPVKIDAIQVVGDNKIDNIGSESLTMAIPNTSTEDGVGVGVGGEAPAAEAENTRYAGQFDKAIELVLRPADVDLPIAGDICKSKVYIAVVSVALELRDVHVQAGALQVPRFKVANAQLRGPWRRLAVYIRAAIGDTAICLGLGRSRSSIDPC